MKPDFNRIEPGVSKKLPEGAALKNVVQKSLLLGLRQAEVSRLVATKEVGESWSLPP